MYAIYMQVRMPLACLLILLYAYFFYRTRKHLRTETSIAFECMAICSLLHLTASIVTEYTVNNRDAVSEQFNLIWHVLFLLTIVGVCNFMFYYLILYVERGLGKKRRGLKMATLVTSCAASLGICILPIEYIDTPQGSYSLGPKAYCLYVMVIYTIVMMIYTIVRYRAHIGAARSNVLLASVAIFILVSIIQILFPYILLTGFASALMVLGIMENTEDVHLYLSYQTGLYNELGCREILQELVVAGKPFQAGVYVFLGHENDIRRGMTQVQSQLPENKSHTICGTLADNVLVVLPLRSLGTATTLPAKLPVPELERDRCQVFCQKMEFDSGRDMAAIVSEIRDYKNRIEADSLQRDELTGLLRRAAFVKQVEYLLESQQDFSFFMLDLDDLKTINDTHGHVAGDTALKGVADALRSALRASDVICRMGGDEFAVALPGLTDENMVQEIYKRIRTNLESADLMPNHSPVTISLGVCIYESSSGAISFQELYAEADAALYHSKYAGKNRVSFAGSQRE